MNKKIQAWLSQISFALFLLIANKPVFAQLKEWKDVKDDPTGCMVDGVPTLKCFEVVAGNLLFMGNMLVLLVLFVMFSLGSFDYLTSFGTPEKVKKAQGTFKFAVLGLILYLSAFLILKIIDVLFLGGGNTLFNFTIGN